MGMGKPDGLSKTQQLDGVFFSFKLLLLLLLCKQVSSQCKILRCNSGFVAATLNLRGSSKNAAYCNALRSYSSCTRKTSHTCRGDLTYHSAVHGIEDLMSQHNCSKDGPVSPPRLRPPLPNREGLELPDVCNYERNFHFKHGKNTSYVYCGVFGDPHIRTFYNEFQTCKIKGAWPLIDNNYLAVQVTNTPVRKDSNATVTSKLTVIFKNVKECIDQKVYQAETDNVPTAFDDGSANGGERQGGNSLTINEKVPERHIEIKAAYIGTTIIVRQVGDHLSFAIRMSEEVATAFTEEQDLQLCVHGCPYNEQIHIMPPPTVSSLVSMETARTKCKEKLPVEDAYFQSCVFDVLILEDTNYTLAAYNAFEDTKTLHPDSEKLHIFKNHVQGCPPLSVSLFIVSLFAGLLLQLI